MTHADQNARLDAIVDALAEYARLDFTPRIVISDAMDTVDAIATGLNMLAEDLHVAVASRLELERALRDLTDAQTKLVHAAKLATIGQLASGVAHEVNNPAGWISLSVGHAKKRVVERATKLDEGLPPANARAILDDIDTLLAGAAEGAERIRVVVSDLRTLARADSEITELVVLDDVASAMCTLLEPSTLVHADLRLALGEVPPVRANRGRLGQVLDELGGECGGGPRARRTSRSGGGVDFGL
jgi:C4-dicarboxylate-specific signal transduction histidine kinase